MSLGLISALCPVGRTPAEGTGRTEGNRAGPEPESSLLRPRGDRTPCWQIGFVVWGLKAQAEPTSRPPLVYTESQAPCQQPVSGVLWGHYRTHTGTFCHHQYRCWPA